jgi:hypothetical protein
MELDSLDIIDPSSTWSFDPAGRLVHLRWAVADLPICLDTPSAALEAVDAALSIFVMRGLTLGHTLGLASVALRDATYAAEVGFEEARRALGRAHALRVERAAALHDSRRRVHRSLATIAEALASQSALAERSAPVHQEKLSAMLALRSALSAFCGGLISAGEERGRLSWAIEVLSAELSVLLANPLLDELAGARDMVASLASRVRAWGSRRPEPLLGRALYREASTIANLARAVSAEPAVVEHDRCALAEVSAILTHDARAAGEQGRVLALLHALRGLDPELDRLELSLIYGAAGAPCSVSLRTLELRSRLSRLQPARLVS